MEGVRAITSGHVTETAYYLSTRKFVLRDWKEDLIFVFLYWEQIFSSLLSRNFQQDCQNWFLRIQKNDFWRKMLRERHTIKIFSDLVWSFLQSCHFFLYLPREASFTKKTWRVVSTFQCFMTRLEQFGMVEQLMSRVFVKPAIYVSKRTLWRSFFDSLFFRSFPILMETFPTLREIVCDKVYKISFYLSRRNFGRNIEKFPQFQQYSQTRSQINWTKTSKSPQNYRKCILRFRRTSRVILSREVFRRKLMFVLWPTPCRTLVSKRFSQTFSLNWKKQFEKMNSELGKNFSITSDFER